MLKISITSNTNIMSRKKIVKRIIISCFIALAIMLISILILLEPSFPIPNWESLDKQKLISLEQNLKFLDSENRNLDLSDDLKVNFIKITDIPQHLIDAFTSIEDNNFYQHSGIDYPRILSATAKNIFSLSYKEGASTISQQLVKNTHLSAEKKILRKIQEIRIAKEMERQFSKDEILEFYLNILYFGDNTYGIKNATSKFFNKTVNELTISESAMLAAIINNPLKFNPISNNDNATTRRNLVLAQMLKYEKISKEQYRISIKEKIIVKKEAIASNNYLSTVISEAASLLRKDANEIVAKKYVIATNYNKIINNRVLLAMQKSFGELNSNYKIVLFENKTGNVVLDIGSNKFSLNFKRPPASIIKPLVYAKGLEDKLFTSSTPILDEQLSFEEYKPKNFNNKYLGWVDIEKALSKSLNIPAIKAMEMIGVNKFVEFAKKFNLEIPKDDYNLSLALGNMSKGFALPDIANAYAVFANGGNFIERSCIRYILDENGKTIFRQKPKVACSSKIIGSDTAYLITDMLKNCSKTGTAKKLRNLPFEQASKTGTNGTKDGNTDAYCITYNSKHTLAVWCGVNNSDRDNKLMGGNLPTTIANLILSSIYNIYPENFQIPNTIIYKNIDINELNENQKVVLSAEGALPINKILRPFSINNCPRNMTNNNKTDVQNDYFCDYFGKNDGDNRTNYSEENIEKLNNLENFEIIDSIIN